MGRYSELFQSAVKEALSGATVLTENRRASRQVLAACESQLRCARDAWETPAVLPWDAWLARTWQECLLSGATELMLLSPAQAQLLWQEIIAGSERAITVGKAGFVKLAWQAWQLLHEYDVPFSVAAFGISPETRNFFEWAQRYSRLCQKNGWTDPACLPDELCTVIAKGAKLPARFALYGFDDFTPQQQRLHAALKSAGVEVVSLVPDQSWTVPASAQCIAAADAEDELTSAARWARSKLQADEGTRIGIVVPRLSDLRAQAEQIFTAVLNPEALLVSNAEAPRAFDLSLGQPLAEYPLIAVALTAVRLAVGMVPTHDATLLIRSPHIGSSQAEASERARFDVHLRGISGPQIDLARLLEALTSERNPVRCPSLKWHLNRFARLAEQLQPQRLPSEWANSISELLEALGWPGNDDRGRPLSSAEYQTVQAWSELLADFSHFDLVTPSMEPLQMCDRIAALAQERLFKPESAGAPVQVLGPFEAAGSVFDHLWITGLSDDVWPARGNANPFLPLALQRAAGVPHCLPSQEFDFARRITARMAQSADDVVFSWPKRQEDTLLRPSPLLQGIADLGSSHVSFANVGHPSSGVVLGDVPDWAALQRTVTAETYNGESAPPLEGDSARGGTRIFELQSNCPFHAFTELRLGATRLDEPQPGLRARDRGKVIETALHLVWAQLRNHFTLMQTPGSELDRIVGESVENAMAEMPAPHEAWEERYLMLERDRLIALVNEWLDIERRREPFDVVAHQREVVVSAGGVTANGRIDRLDRTSGDGGLVVIDYKSGNATYGPGQWSGERPERPQLPLYVISQNQPVSAVAFAQLRTGGCDLKGLAERKEILGKSRDNSKQYLNGNTFEQHIAEWRPVLEKIGQSFRDGVAAPDPLPERVCEYCHLPAVCRRAELETDDPCQHGEVDDEE